MINRDENYRRLLLQVDLGEDEILFSEKMAFNSGKDIANATRPIQNKSLLKNPLQNKMLPPTTSLQSSPLAKTGKVSETQLASTTPDFSSCNSLDSYYEKLTEMDFYKKRRLIPFKGIGPLKSPVMVLLFEPTPEDIQGLFLSSHRGVLLAKMLQVIEMNINQCYVSFFVKAPMQKASLLAREKAFLVKALECEIKWVKPENILMLGSECSEPLLSLKEPLVSAGLKLFYFCSTPAFATHSLEILDNDNIRKRESWSHLQMMHSHLLGKTT